MEATDPFTKNTELHELMKDPLANTDEIQRLLNKEPPPDVNAQNNLGYTPLMVGAISGDLEDGDIIQRLMRLCDLTLRDNEGNTTLHIFSKWGVFTCFDELVKRSDVLATNKKEETSLHHVKNVTVLKSLIDWYKSKKNWPPTPYSGEFLANVEDFLKVSNQDKKAVIEEFCSEYQSHPKPSDFSAAILKVLKTVKQSSPKLVYDLLYCLLQSGEDLINEEHVRQAIKLDMENVFNRVIEHCRNISDIVEKTDVLLCCLRSKKNSSSFYTRLKQQLTNPSTQLLEIQDSRGSNLAHYLCKFEKYELLAELLIEDSDLAAKLFSKFDKSKEYPLTLIRDPKPEFFGLFKDFLSEKKFSVLNSATPTQNLLHYAVEKKKNYVGKLLDAGFAITTDGSNKTLLHKIVINFDSPDLLQKVLFHLSEVDDVEYINLRDSFNFTALEYCIVYKKEKQFRFLKDRQATVEEDRLQKLLQFVAFEKAYSEAQIGFVLEDFQLSYPTKKDDEAIKEIRRSVLKSEQAVSYKTPETDSSDAPQTTFNVIIAHHASCPVVTDLSSKLSDSSTQVLVHHISLESVSVDDIDNLARLANKTLYVVQDNKDTALFTLLTRLIGAKEQFHVRRFPENVSLRRVGSVNLALLMTNQEFISHCSAQPIGRIDDKYKTELLDLQQLTGHFYLSQCRDFYRSSLYVTEISENSIENEALEAFGLINSYYSDNGSKELCHRMRSKWVDGVSPGQGFYFDFRVMREGGLNVSRFVTPTLTSLLISGFLLVPKQDSLIILPETSLSFEVHLGGGQLEFVRAVISGPNVDHTTRDYVISILRSNKVKRVMRRKQLDFVYKARDDSIFDNIPRTSDKYSREDGPTEDDVESALLDEEEIEEPIRGESPLMKCNLGAVAAAFTDARKPGIPFPVQRYFKTVDQECAMLTDVGKSSKKLLHRLIASSVNGYTVKQFIQDGHYSTEQREALCKAIGVDVGETYSPVQNCVRLNWVDFTILGLGILIVVVILVVCEMLEVDLDSYGVAGVATVPFVMSLLNRARKSLCPNYYSNLESVTPEE